MLEFLRKHQYGLMLVVAILTIIAFVFLYDKNTYGQGGGVRGTAFKIYGKGYNASHLQKLDNYYLLARELGLWELTSSLQGKRVVDGRPVDFPLNLMILRKEARELGISPSNDDVQKEIEEMRIFMDPATQKFDPTRFKRISENLTGRNFQNADITQIIRDKITLDSVKKLLAANTLPPVPEVEDMYNIRNEKITAYALKRALEDHLEDAKASDDEIKQRYDDTQETRMTDEQRQIEYVIFQAPVYPTPAPSNQGSPNSESPETGSGKIGETDVDELLKGIDINSTNKSSKEGTSLIGEPAPDPGPGEPEAGGEGDGSTDPAPGGGEPEPGGADPAPAGENEPAGEAGPAGETEPEPQPEPEGEGDPCGAPQDEVVDDDVAGEAGEEKSDAAPGADATPGENAPAGNTETPDSDAAKTDDTEKADNTEKADDPVGDTAPNTEKPETGAGAGDNETEATPGTPGAVSTPATTPGAVNPTPGAPNSTVKIYSPLEKKEIKRSFDRAAKIHIERALKAEKEAKNSVDLAAVAAAYLAETEGKLFSGSHATSELFSREEPPDFIKDARPPAQAQQPIDVIFGMEKGQLSRPIKLINGGREDWILFRVTDVVAPKPLSFEDTKEDIAKELQDEKAEEALKGALEADVEKIKAEMAGKNSFKASADKLEIEYARHYKFTGSPTPDELGNYYAYADLIRNTVPGEFSEPKIAGDKGYLVYVAAKAVEDEKPKEAEEKKLTIESQLSDPRFGYGRQIFDAWLSRAYERAEPSRQL